MANRSRRQNLTAEERDARQALQDKRYEESVKLNQEIRWEALVIALTEVAELSRSWAERKRPRFDTSTLSIDDPGHPDDDELFDPDRHY